VVDRDRRHRALLDDIADHGWQWPPAVGGDPAGSHREDGVLLLDADAADAAEVGVTRLPRPSHP